MLLIYNAHHDIVNLTLPAVAEGRNWTGLIDTNQPENEMPTFKFGNRTIVARVRSNCRQCCIARCAAKP